jgi:hypothetical protein
MTLGLQGLRGMSEPPQFREYTVIALRRQQLWAQDARGQVLRAWRPEHGGVHVGARVLVYGDQDSDIEGWHDPHSRQSVDQRCFYGSAAAEPRSLACLGACGLVWEAPAGDAVLASGNGCLQCEGVVRQL